MRSRLRAIAVYRGLTGIPAGSACSESAANAGLWSRKSSRPLGSASSPGLLSARCAGIRCAYISASCAEREWSLAAQALTSASQQLRPAKQRRRPSRHNAGHRPKAHRRSLLRIRQSPYLRKEAGRSRQWARGATERPHIPQPGEIARFEKCRTSTQSVYELTANDAAFTDSFFPNWFFPRSEFLSVESV